MHEIIHRRLELTRTPGPLDPLDHDPRDVLARDAQQRPRVADEPLEPHRSVKMLPASAVETAIFRPGRLQSQLATSLGDMGDVWISPVLDVSDVPTSIR